LNEDWAADNGDLLSEKLTSGGHTIRIRFTADAPADYPNAHNARVTAEVISNPIEIEIAEVAWGEADQGVQLGLSDWRRAFHIGESASYTLWVRTATDQPVDLSHYNTVFLASPRIVDEQGVLQAMDDPEFDGPVLRLNRHLDPGRAIQMGSVSAVLDPSLRIPRDHRSEEARVALTPGEYRVTQAYLFLLHDAMANSPDEPPTLNLTTGAIHLNSTR